MCCISRPATLGPTKVPSPVPASARPEALLRFLTNQRCTAVTVGTYTRPTPSPTSEQNATRKCAIDRPARLLTKKPSASSTTPAPTTLRVDVRSAIEPANTPTA